MKGGAKRTERVVRRIEGMPERRQPDLTRVTLTDAEFWTLSTGSDVAELRFTFVCVYPEAGTDRVMIDFWSNVSEEDKARILPGVAEAQRTGKPTAA
ncbi:MAG TPA: hypothetical protein VEA69_02895 [Tepidisphaeraceae bacterium]|nr:hypothetical protein [Tepidisphaeraceae bacterium]